MLSTFNELNVRKESQLASNSPQPLNTPIIHTPSNDPIGVPRFLTGGGPNITIQSPINDTYNHNNIWLKFTTDKPTLWIGYSLDEAPNVTITDNLFLTSLTEGSHFVKIFANDTSGNMGQSDTVWFTIDTVAPTITVISPDVGKTKQEYVWLNVTVNEPTSWMGYSLWGEPNVTFSGHTLLGPLSEDIYLFDIYANDTAGNMGGGPSGGIWIDLTPPIVNIISPRNDTYSERDVLLNLSINEWPTWISYSLDNNPNESISASEPFTFTLTNLDDGSHSIIVYTQDGAGNEVASSIVWFTIDCDFPYISINSPGNGSYPSLDVWLNFTIDEVSSWIGYSLDGNLNITVTGDTLLTSLSEGSHSVVICANDSVGNMGSSTLVWFTIDLTPPIVNILTPSQVYYLDPNILVQYSISETGTIQFYLNDVPYPFIANESTITLLDGEYNLTLKVTDQAGNIGIVTVIFTIDTLSPNGIIISPGDQYYNYEEIIVSWLQEPGSTLVAIYVDKTSISLTNNSVEYFAEGVHNITLVIQDQAGNVRIITSIFAIDLTLPEVIILSPISTTYHTTDVTLSFNVNVEEEVQVAILVYLDGELGPLLNNSIIPELTEGQHNLTIEVTDAAGNKVVKTVDFIVETPFTTLTTSSIPITTTTEESTPRVSEGFEFAFPLTIFLIMVFYKKKR